MFKSWSTRIFAALIMIYGLSDGISGFFENRAYRKHGKTVQVEPLIRYSQEVTTRTKRNQTSTTVVNSGDISFTTENALRITVNKRIPDIVLEEFKRQHKVEIMYLENDPYRTKWPDETKDVSTMLTIGFISFVVLYISFKSSP